MPGEAAAFVGAAVETFGRLDGLVCAATGRVDGHALLDDDRMAWEAEAVLALLHPLEALQTAVPALAARGGAAVFISSSLDQKVRLLAAELSERSVRVNAIAPGEASAEAIADLAVFLLSPRAQSINGTLIPAHGGRGRPSRQAMP